MRVLKVNKENTKNILSDLLKRSPNNYDQYAGTCLLYTSICGLGESVGCERVERTFNAPRLKSQICLIGSNGFVCSLSNELNSNLYHIFELFIIIY